MEETFRKHNLAAAASRDPPPPDQAIIILTLAELNTWALHMACIFATKGA